MILDNQSTDKKVHEWITRYTRDGSIDSVTGYFTVGALAFLSDQINDRIKQFRFIIGDIVKTEVTDERPLDLLNESLTVEGALNLKGAAVKAVEFLRQSKVRTKTMEPNFCHAKFWLFNGSDAPDNYFITGSSNLTTAGLGLKPTHNIELNSVGQGTHSDYRELKEWFEELWNRPEASFKKTVGGRKVDFKQYLINEISRIFTEYTPRDLYYKTLFEMFGRPLMQFQDDPSVSRNIGRLEHSEIYKALYEFQKKGVISLIKMLQTHGGAILADAVGLGKTWSALAVMKYYQSLGYDLVLLCPKKLDHNWRRFLKNHESRFEKDELDYVIRYHTDLQDDRMQRHADGIKMDFFQRQRPKLFVIDESHNLRNSKSNRYRFLVDNILKKNDDIKVLLLSATPINNTLLDVRNQFKLLVKDNPHGFRDTLGISNLDSVFKRATQAFSEWSQADGRTLSSFLRALPPKFFTLTDALVVSRTRRLIQGHTDHLTFPEKEPPENIFLEGSIIGKYDSFEKFIDAFPRYFAGYMPAYYIEQAEDINVLEDERQRDFFLTKMMQMLLVKRLESSWRSFQTTLEKVLEHHRGALAKVKHYKAGQANEEMKMSFANIIDADADWAEEEFTLGKRAIPISDIAGAGNLNRFKKHLEDDIRRLEDLAASLAWFEKQMNAEKEKGRPSGSRDEKLARLIDLIQRKRKAGENRGNDKILIFTAYTDTAHYLYDQLLARGFTRIAVVSGSESRVWDAPHAHKDFEPILERFAPCTKLFGEREWPGFHASTPDDIPGSYRQWQEWIHDNSPEVADKLAHPVDILIATDCLSEGQNLQDCDYVVNYDIHWNPVRSIQRMGRIDRLGSVNQKVFAANFWPTREIDTYLKLQRRIEDKMAQMGLVGAEVRSDFTEGVKQMLDDEHIQQSQQEKLLKQLQDSWEDIETGEDELGFDKLSLENFRQELLGELGEDKQKYLDMPNGVYTGFLADPRHCPSEGIIALLGYPAGAPGRHHRSYTSYDLVYIDREGNDVLLNPKDILAALARHKDNERVVPEGLDSGDSHELTVWANAIRNWLHGQAVSEVEDQDGCKTPVAGAATMDYIKQMQHGDKTPDQPLPPNQSFEDRYKTHNVDLILWFAVTKKE
ncbi:MAG: helicase-related protein [Verrucomicrobiota bacterium]